MKPDIGAYVNPEYSEQLMRLNSVSANVRAVQSGTDYILFWGTSIVFVKCVVHVMKENPHWVAD